MKRKEFKKFIEAIEYQSDISRELYKSKVDLIEYDEMFHKIISILGKKLFTEDGWDIIGYYLYEAKTKTAECMWEADGTNIPMKTPDDLYNYLTKTKCI